MLPTAATSGLGRSELVRGGQVEVAVVASEALSDERRRRAAEHGRLPPGPPQRKARRNPAENASPQPVVSTTSTLKAGTSSLPSPSTISAPSAPLVATTQPTPPHQGPASGGEIVRAAQAEHLVVVRQQVVELAEGRGDPVD